jgi:hypothetical protein
MARNKQYNEQEDRKSDVFILAQWVSTSYVCWKGNGQINFLFMQVLETWRFRRKLEML